MKKEIPGLSKRERQILDIVYGMGRATAAEIRQALPDELSDSGVRTLLRVMLKKDVLKYTEENLKYVYYPTVPREKAQASALDHVKKTFFENSAERVMTALLKSTDVTEKDLDRLEKLIAQARREGK